MGPPIIVFLLLFSTQLAHAAEKWLKLQSPTFEMYTNANSRTAGEMLGRLEDFRTAMHAVQENVEITMPVRVILFRTENDFRPYRWAKSREKTGYFLPGRRYDHVVMHATGRRVLGSPRTGWHIRGQDPEHTLFHEFVHLLQHQSTAHLPLWFEEGTAELYSNISLSKGKARVGKPIPAHLRTLKTRGWIETETFASVDDESSLYTEGGAAARVFYAQSWALVHMLHLSPPYRGRTVKFVDALNQAVRPVAAFEQAFGKSIAAAMKDLRSYVRTARLAVQDYVVDTPGNDAKPSEERISFFKARLILCDLLLELHRVLAAEKLLKELALEQPDRAEVEMRLGEAALQYVQHEDARRHLERAIQLGSEDARTHFAYARLLEETRGDREQIASSYRKAVALDPRAPLPRLYLGIQIISEKLYSEALRHLEVAAKARPRWSPVWRMSARVHHHLGQADEARTSAHLALLTARTEHQKASAREVLEMLETASVQPQP